MNANDYQREAARTLIDGPDFEISPNNQMIIWNALGLAGEAGEIANSVKKMILHQHGIDIPKLQEELSDCCWYIAALCTKLGISLDDVLSQNIAKLHTRYPDGYSSAASKARVDLKWFADPFNDPAAVQGESAVKRASVRSPLPGDTSVCLHCQEQIQYTQYGEWRHTAIYPFPPGDHTAEPHPF